MNADWPSGDTKNVVLVLVVVLGFLGKLQDEVEYDAEDDSTGEL